MECGRTLLALSPLPLVLVPFMVAGWIVWLDTSVGLATV
jgi:hypothetical protein